MTFHKFYDIVVYNERKEQLNRNLEVANNHEI